ncbi:tripartite tricarboxylate transporter permease [Nocardiopsis nanhaiensis]
MYEAITTGMAQVLAWETMAFVLLGVALGFIVGLLPGLGGAVAIALLLPFAFNMEPIHGLAFLIAMWIVTSTASDITSVLFGIPGEATAAAAVFDGYPLTKRGQAGRALGAILCSSLIGGLVGAIALSVLITVIRPLVLVLGPPEFFALTVLGMTFIVTLSGKRPARGVIMVAAGLLVAYIGIDPTYGIPRYTFGNLDLWEGIALVPVVIGLFGGAEVLQLMLSRSSVARTGSGNRVTGTLAGFLDALRHWFLIVRSSMIGVGIGMLPGLGGSVAQWVAYGQAKQLSKNPEQFGKGSIEGVVAAGSTSNAKDSGSLIPTIAFGIPGGAATAVLLGGFLILGITPGRDMLTTQLDVTFSLIWIAIISGILAVIIAIPLIRPLAHLTRINGSTLVPGLLLLLVIGSFSINGSVTDIVIMLLATGVGVFCIRWDWPRIPFLLALVLGGLIESYLNLSVMLFGWDWVTRPGVIALGVVIVLTVSLGVRSVRRGNRSSTSPTDAPKQDKAATGEAHDDPR